MRNGSCFVSVILPAHNEEAYLKESLTAITNQTYDNDSYEVILVDNNSTDATAAIARSFGIQVIEEPEGPVGKVRNSGVNVAKGELLLFLDSDCVAPKDWISYAVSMIGADESLVLGGGYELRANPQQLERYWLLGGKEGATLPKDLLGGCIAIKKSAFLEVGGFDEGVTSGEDSKLSEALKLRGFKVVIDRKMSVIHLGNPTNISNFFRRQIWHSENYIHDFRKSVKDPTFLLLVIFLVSLLLSLMAFVLHITYFWLPLLSAAFVPGIFSIKRIIRSRNLLHLKNFHQIYTIDLIYIAGRTIGLFKGIYRLGRHTLFRSGH